MEIISLVVGLVIGGAVVWYVSRLKQSGSQLVDQERLKQLDSDNLNLRDELEGERAKVMDLNGKLATEGANHRNLQEKLNEQKQELERLQEKFTKDFQLIANNILEEKSQKFTDQNKSNIGELLNPLREKITEFEKRIELNSRQSLEQSTALREQIKGLRELNTQMSKDAENLTKALKGDTKIQGNWGEFILESILEKSGLEKGREYFVQNSMTQESGRRLQPDVVVKLPENKNIIVDSKVSLIAYERYINSDMPAMELKAHLASIRAHIKGLGEKNYHQLYGVEGLDFILMFIPIEPAFSLAIQGDPELFNEAYNKNIVIVSPTTLIATLRTISNIWKNEYQNRNALEIARQGGDLYDKFVAFSEDLMKLGKSMQTTQVAYEEAMKKLVDGKGNLISRVVRIKELGAKTSKQIDQKLIDRAEDMD